MTITCPKCNVELDLPVEAVGKCVQCPSCLEHFIGDLPEPVKPILKDIYSQGYNRAIKCETFRTRWQSLVNDLDQSCESNSLEDFDRSKIKIIKFRNEIDQYFAFVREELENEWERQTSQSNIILKFFRICWRKILKQEFVREKMTSYSSLHTLFDQVTVKINMLDKLREKIAQREIALEFVRKIHANGNLVTIDPEGFQCKRNECLYLKVLNVSAYIIKTFQGEDEKIDLGTGVLYITNSRVVFESQIHRQTYSLANIRDFGYYEDSYSEYSYSKKSIITHKSIIIRIETCAKRREFYVIDGADKWLVVLVIMYCWNTAFREWVLSQNKETLIDGLVDRIFKEHI